MHAKYSLWRTPLCSCYREILLHIFFMKYHIVVFGCAANVADAKRIEHYYEDQGHIRSTIGEADEVIIVTCMIRESAEARVYGLIRNLRKKRPISPRIIITGCMTGMILGDKTGKLKKRILKRISDVAFIPIEELGLPHTPHHKGESHALVHISNGCNNFCTYCVVPYARGKEVSRPYADIIRECKDAILGGANHITLIGQNVNSYGSDLIQSQALGPQLPDIHTVTYVKHLGKMRIPTVFPHLLKEVSELPGIKIVDFISSNPWDFSDDLISVIANHETIARNIHLPVQSGDTEVLRRMNRWYTREEYLQLTEKIKKTIPDVTFSTDIIVGFPGETEVQFEKTVDLCKKVGFQKAYVAIYSDRPLTVAHKTLGDDVPFAEKKRRWKILEELINKPNLNTFRKDK